MKKYVVADNKLYETKREEQSIQDFGGDFPSYTTDGTVLINNYTICTAPESSRGIGLAVAIKKQVHEIVGVIQRESDDILGLIREGDYCKLLHSPALFYVNEATLNTFTMNDLEEIWIKTNADSIKRIWSKH